jgi:signal transduction histidine kinase
MLAIFAFLIVCALVSFVAGFLAMTVEIACNSKTGTKADQSYYVQVAACAGLAAMLGFCLARLLGGPMLCWALVWAVLPAVFRIVSFYVSGRAFVDRFVGAGQRCALVLKRREAAKAAQQQQKPDQKTTQAAARAAIEAIERELNRKRSDEDGSAQLT